jgi:hypothetical protein
MKQLVLCLEGGSDSGDLLVAAMLMKHHEPHHHSHQQQQLQQQQQQVKQELAGGPRDCASVRACCLLHMRRRHLSLQRAPAQAAGTLGVCGVCLSVHIVFVCHHFVAPNAIHIKHLHPLLAAVQNSGVTFRVRVGELQLQLMCCELWGMSIKGFRGCAKTHSPCRCS